MIVHIWQVVKVSRLVFRVQSETETHRTLFPPPIGYPMISFQADPYLRQADIRRRQLHQNLLALSTKLQSISHSMAKQLLQQRILQLMPDGCPRKLVR
jgi:hypothetical protein